MKKLLLYSAILATFALFSACGDDSSSGPEEESSSSIEVEDESSSSVEEEGKSSAADKKSSSSEAKKGDSSSSIEATSSSGEAKSSSSIAEESSSSNVIASSSSAKQSSSSSSVVFPEGVMSAGYYAENCPAGHTCKDAAPSTYLKSGITYGEILDTRDDQVYKVVTIGEGDDAQTWMAQNLNYAYNEGTAKSYCYDGDSDNCAKYGRLYLWSAAMDSAAIYSNTSKGCGYYGSTCSASGPVQGVCPEGWHLPSKAEWDTLFTNVGGEEVAGRMLKSEEGWFYYSESTEGIDYYGFSALPAGYRYDYGYFYGAGYYAIFWSSSEYTSYDACGMYLNYNYEDANLRYTNKAIAFSVRCIKD